MSTIQIRSLGPIIGLVIVAAFFGSQTLAQKQSGAADVKNPKLKKLLDEKLEILQKVATLFDEGFKRGEVDFEDCYNAKVSLRHAQLELCENDADRTEILERSLKDAQQFEAEIKKLVALNELAMVRELRAHANCLEVQIDLERLKGK